MPNPEAVIFSEETLKNMDSLRTRLQSANAPESLIELATTLIGLRSEKKISVAEVWDFVFPKPSEASPEVSMTYNNNQIWKKEKGRWKISARGNELLRGGRLEGNRRFITPPRNLAVDAHATLYAMKLEGNHFDEIFKWLSHLYEAAVKSMPDNQEVLLENLVERQRKELEECMRELEVERLLRQDLEAQISERENDRIELISEIEEVSKSLEKSEERLDSALASCNRLTQNVLEEIQIVSNRQISSNAYPKSEVNEIFDAMGIHRIAMERILEELTNLRRGGAKDNSRIDALEKRTAHLVGQLDGIQAHTPISARIPETEEEISSRFGMRSSQDIEVTSVYEAFHEWNHGRTPGVPEQDTQPIIIPGIIARPTSPDSKVGPIPKKEPKEASIPSISTTDADAEFKWTPLSNNVPAGPRSRLEEYLRPDEEMKEAYLALAGFILFFILLYILLHSY